ncbi:MAG: UvrD-helicase domain-containing protein [Deltaproteobacteria bacterium]|nr:UvrD-helicase domain-containing protein [Deltaproteobacteria bacterium]
MFQDLTFQQFCSLDYKRNMVVTAGPGSGKTKILSKRFCFILLTDRSVFLPNILTLTFTEKAAEEMKGRIYAMLGHLENQLHENDFLRNRAREARVQFHKNRISTIHSFCADLLREHPVESGIDPEFSIIKGSQQRKLMDESIDKGISMIWNEDKENVSSLLQSFNGYGRLKTGVRNLMAHPLTLKRVAATSKRIFVLKDWEMQVFNEYCLHLRDDLVVPYLTGLREAESLGGQYHELRSILEEWHKSSADMEYSGIPVLFGKLRDLVCKRKSGSPRLSILRGLKEISYVDLVAEWFPDVFMNSSADRVYSEQLDLFIRISEVCLGEYAKEKEKINSLDFADLETRSHNFLRRLSVSGAGYDLQRICQKFRYVMVDEFQDTNRVQWEIIRFLCAGKGGYDGYFIQPGRLFVVGDKKQAIYKFRGGDVTVFESVTEEILKSNPDPPVEMFWKDSGIKALMMDMTGEHNRQPLDYIKEFEGLPLKDKASFLKGDIYLPHNFRSSLCPVNFINRTFDWIFSNRFADDPREYETLNRKIVMAEKENGTGSKGSATVYLTSSSSKGKDRAEREAVIVAGIIESILGRHGENCYEYRTYASVRENIKANRIAIGMLFFSFNNLKIFETILREADLPFKVHRGRGLFRTPEVMEIVQLLNYIADERENISLLSVLRSQIFGLKDSEIFDLFYHKNVSTELLLGFKNMGIRKIGEQIQSWRRLSNSLTVAELIRKVIQDRYLVAVNSIHPNSKQRLANMEKLIETARRFQVEDKGYLKDFVDHCLRMAEEDEEEGEALLITSDESPINLMTIHAAKGLEFPMVIIPDLDRRVPALPDTGKPMRVYRSENDAAERWNSVEGELPVWPLEIPELDFEKNYGPLGRLLVRRNRLEEIAENRRVFYVGCTRTKEHLVLIGHMNKGSRTRNGSELTPQDYRERASILELLNDIYHFHEAPKNNGRNTPESEETLPRVIWLEPEKRVYRSLRRGGKEVSQDELGIYDDRIRKIDLSDPVKVPGYFQFSFRSLSMFRKCPLRFFYTVVSGLRWDWMDHGERDVHLNYEEYEGFKENVDTDILQGDSLSLGGIVHEYLEMHVPGKPFDDELFQRLLNKYCNDDMEKRGSNPSGSLGDRAFRHINNVLKDERLSEMMKGREIFSELPFLIKIRNGCEFRGVIDRLLIDKDKGSCLILDWKTNDLTCKEATEIAEENDYVLQVACYEWAVEQILNKNVGHKYIYFTDTGYLLESEWKGKPVDIINEILEAIDEYGMDRELWMQASRIMDYNGRRCLHCEYRGILCKEKYSNALK